MGFCIYALCLCSTKKSILFVVCWDTSKIIERKICCIHRASLATEVSGEKLIPNSKRVLFQI